MAAGVAKGQKQDYQMPLNIPALLSGNYGELRANHFHSGIDFKTQGVVGKPVFAVMDGYVSRVSV
ncbi:MAG: M23 family peptidase, partial [Tannerellaceae bacterium]